MTGHSFAATLAMMMTNSSLESPKPYLFARYLSKSVAALFSHVILFQKNPIYLMLILQGDVCLISGLQLHNLNYSSRHEGFFAFERWGLPAVYCNACLVTLSSHKREHV